MNQSLYFLLCFLLTAGSLLGEDDESSWISSPNEKRERDFEARMTLGQIGNRHVRFRNTGPYLKTIELHKNMAPKCHEASAPFPIIIPDRGEIDLIALALIPQGEVPTEINYRNPDGKKSVELPVNDIPSPKLNKRHQQIRLILKRDFKEFNIRRISVFDANTHVEINKLVRGQFPSKSNPHIFALDIPVNILHTPPLKVMIDLVKTGVKHEVGTRLWFDLPKAFYPVLIEQPKNLFDIKITNFSSAYSPNLFGISSILSAISGTTQFEVDWGDYNPKDMKEKPLDLSSLGKAPTPRMLMREFLRCAPQYGFKIDKNTHTIHIIKKADPNAREKDEKRSREILKEADGEWEFESEK